LIAHTPRITNIEDGITHLKYEEPTGNEDGTINSKIKTIENDIETKIKKVEEDITTIFSGTYDYVEETDGSKTSKQMF
jgi:hypothetical protein